jgi:hypothetical protein
MSEELRTALLGRRDDDTIINLLAALLTGQGPNGEILGIATVPLAGRPKFTWATAVSTEARMIVPDRERRIGGTLFSFHMSAVVYASYKPDFVAAMGQEDVFPLATAPGVNMMGGRMSILLTNCAYYVRVPDGAASGLVCGMEVLPL